MTTVPDSISLLDLSRLWIQKALEEIAAENQQAEEGIELEEEE
ncbi:hypothetical protein LEP3755_14050 [Leptolyngbya sp. NIES-3755]|nr:hypothetical protein LEP3755_14050 [Leptolyngbya sp. NIES-3755]